MNALKEDCLRLHDELVIARAQEGREVGRKGRVAAHVLENVLAVAEDFCPLVARADVQKKTHTCRDRRDGQRPVVPERLPGMQRTIDARELRFRRKRNKDPAVPGVRTCVGIRDGLVPETVRIAIAFAHHLRARVFLQDCVWIELFAPDCFHTRASRAAARFFRSSTSGMMNSSTTAAAKHRGGVGTISVTPRSP